MKIIQNLLAVFCCSALLFACSKEGSVETGNGGVGGSNVGRAKTYTETIISQGDSESYTYNLFYDNAGRLITMSNAGAPDFKFAYAFPSATLFTGDLFTGGTTPEIHTDYYLNGQSYIDSALTYDNDKDSSASKLIYNSTGQLITQRDYEYKDGVSELIETTTFTYNGDGQVEKGVTSGGLESRFTYYTDAKHPAPYIIGPLNDRVKASMYLEKTRTVYQSGALLGSADHTYTFDSQGRILTDNAELSDGTVAIKTYTY